MKPASIAASCLLACIAFAGGVLAQQPSAALVNVPVQITDFDGRPVTNLQSGDFMLFENRVVQAIKTFTKGETAGAYILSYAPALNPSASDRPIEVRVALPNVGVRMSEARSDPR